ncbi:hypothetical protein TNIN_18631 [Trichonephila inaurata madagascariensis]|uniref:Uncharacterized protein n=1 Tax=Trichonephila inaurata madagascariensis TaxID=2747483 RepID=A0A8X6YDX7_9ARAC|nr:hypothetical protein TNIN_18631 [Trichonephila inaurata madagascariensis]
MVKGVASKSTMMSDSDSDMDSDSEISGHSFKSRSSRSGTSISMTSTTECQTLKDVMKRICVAEKPIKHYENQEATVLPAEDEQKSNSDGTTCSTRTSFATLQQADSHQDRT